MMLINCVIGKIETKGSSSTSSSRQAANNQQLGASAEREIIDEGKKEIRGESQCSVRCFE